jgi:hypothetical protein
MRLFYWGKDGGPESTVNGFWLVEIKSLFSIVLLRIGEGSRDVYHEHAFNCISWILKGRLLEYRCTPGKSDTVYTYRAGLLPVVTKREHLHKVFSVGTTWAVSFRGPWSKTWREYGDGHYTTLTNGRVKV